MPYSRNVMQEPDNGYVAVLSLRQQALMLGAVALHPTSYQWQNESRDIQTGTSVDDMACYRSPIWKMTS